MILVAAASGNTGLAVIRALTARGRDVRAFIRDPTKTASVRGAGAADVVVGNLLDLAAVESAALGVEGLFFIGPSFVAEEAVIGCAVVDIAQKLGVERFVYSGVYHPTISFLFNHSAKQTIEERLYRSDLEFTVLQPARMIHNLIFSSWPRLSAENVLADAFSPEVPIAYVDYDDVAEVAAIAFDGHRLARGSFELALPGEHTLRDLARELTQVLGREIRAEQVPIGSYGPAGRLLANPYAAAGFDRLREYYDHYGFRGGNSLVLGAILGHPVADLRTALGKVIERCARGECQ